VDVPAPEGDVPAEVISGAITWSTERTGARSEVELVLERRDAGVVVVFDGGEGCGELGDNDAGELVDADEFGGHGGLASPCNRLTIRRASPLSRAVIPETTWSRAEGVRSESLMSVFSYTSENFSGPKDAFTPR
jgi:hypothetical protein